MQSTVRRSVPPVLMVEAHKGQGGPPTTVRDLAPELHRRRDILVAIPDGVVSQQLNDGPLPVPTIRLPWTGRRARDRALSGPVLALALQRLGRSAIVHANGKSALNLVGPVVRALRWRPRVFMHFHDSELGAKTANVIRVWAASGVRLSIAAVSEQSSALLHTSGLGHLVSGRLPNPIAPPAASSVIQRSVSSPFCVAAVVDRWPRKGLDVVVGAAHVLREDGVRFDVFGVHESFPRNEFFDRCLELRRQWNLGSRVVLKGRVENFQEHLPKYDCLFVTSRRESFCRVALEGMASGVPVVAPRIDGLTEAVGEGNCVLYETGDAAAGARGIMRLRDDPQIAARLAAAGLERARRYAPERICDELEALYRTSGLSC